MSISTKSAFLLIVSGVMVACSSSVPRTVWNDKNMRVLIDPDSIDEENYVRIQQALVGSGKFMVVDRARGFRAIKKEQERLHQDEPDRYSPREKWAHWGKLYGVGAIVVPHTQCVRKHSTFIRTKIYLSCKQFLSMVDANTGEIIVGVSGDNDGESSYDMPFIAPDWEETVQKLVDNYPKYFRKDGYAEQITDYQELSAEHAQRQRERRAPASQPATYGQPKNNPTAITPDLYKMTVEEYREYQRQREMEMHHD